ncbi:MAG: hypothetical protein AB7F28_00470 [Candidatus Margulisiibacteriota bacterium]
MKTETTEPPTQNTHQHPDQSTATESFLNAIQETEFNRGGTAGGGVPGLAPFIEGRVPDVFKNFYSPEELEALAALKGTDRDIENRMKVKLTEHYLRLALQSKAIQNLVKARPEETEDLSGEADPSNQNKYSPLPGLLHKYEMILLYTAATCSAHCRYCYRLDLFSRKTGKEMASIDNVATYIRNYNNNPENPYPIREALLSGGDVMVLPNKRIAKFLTGLAETGLRTIRLGTKELAFFPERFDQHFFDMLDGFNQLYPDVRLLFITHFSHPDEFLEKDASGNYIKSGTGFKWLEVTRKAVEGLAQRHRFISLENQTPIIYKVNDDPDALRLLQQEMVHVGIGNHYLFQCREIEGHKTFAVPVETTWRIYNESQRGLSGVEKQAKFVMSTEIGKMEVIGVTQGQTIFRLLRSPGDAGTHGNIIIAKSNPDALWITGYKDRIISDDTHLLSTNA